MIIDRFEEDKAVLYTERGMITAERAGLPEDAKEGDILDLSDGKYMICKSETDERKNNNTGKFKKLKNKNGI